MAADGSIIIDTKIDESELDRIVSEVSAKLGSIEKNTGNAFAKMRDFMQGPVEALRMVKDALSALYNTFIVSASSAAELQNKYDVVFAGVTEDVNTWINTYATATARGVQSTKEFLTSLQDIRTGYGDSISSAAKFSQAVVGVTNDLSSFSNVPVAEASAAIQSGLSGQFEALRRLGVGLSVAIIDQGDYAKSLGLTWDKMSNLQKQEAILSGIMSQSKNAIGQNIQVWSDYDYTLGDAAKTSDSFANQTQKLQGSLGDAAAIIGQQFLGASLSLITAINDVVSGFISWASSGDNLAQTLETLKMVLITGAATLGVYALASGALTTAMTASMIPAFAALKASVIAATRAMMANPFVAIATVLTAILVPAILLLIKHWDEVVVFMQTTAALLGQKIKILGVNIESAFVVGFNSAKIAALEFATIIIDKVFGVVQKLLGVLAKLPGVGDMFKDVSNDVEAFKNKLQDSANASIQESQTAISAAKAKKAAIIQEGNEEIAKIKQVGAVRMESVRKQKNEDASFTDSLVSNVDTRDAAETKAAEKGTKRAEKKKKEQEEELYGIEKIAKAYEDLQTKMNDGSSSFLSQMQSVNDLLSTSFTGLGETLDLLTFAGPIGSAMDLYDQIIEISGAIETIITEGPEKAAEMADTLLDAIIGILDNLPALVTKIVEIIQTIIIKVIEALPDILTGLLESSLTLGPSLSIAVMKAIPDMVKALALFPVELVRSLPQSFRNLASAFMEMGKEIVRMIGNGITAIGSLIKWIGEILPKPSDIKPFNIGDIGTAIVEAIAAGINFAGSLFEKVRYYFTQFFEALKNFFVNIPSIGAAIVDGIVNGIMSAPSIWDRVVSKFQDFIDGVKRFFMISSPSKVFAGFGGNIMDGIVEGILNAPDLFEQVKDVFQSFLDSIADLFSQGFDIGAGLWDSIKDGVSSVGDAAKGASNWIGDKTGWWKTGGYTGDGNPNDVAGFVHKGEYVLNADETKALGLDNKSASIAAVMSGLSSGVSVPSAVSAAQSVMITIQNNLTAILQLDGRELTRTVMQTMDSVGGAYFGSQG